ncbi:MAG: Xaa-Pro peptidase family protein [Thermoplasmata archaeon]
MTDKEFCLKYCSPSKEIPFTKTEYRERLHRIRDSMRKKRIDVLYLTSPESLYYVSGYKAEWYQAQSPRSWPPISGIAIHVDHDHFIHFDYIEELVMARYTSIADDVRIYPEGHQRSIQDWIVSELKKDGWIPGRVGLEMCSYRPYRAASEDFQKRLEKKGCKALDATDIVRDLRAIKSPKELEYIEKAAKIADIGMSAVAETMRAGMTELEVYGEMIRAMAKAGGENPAITLPVASGKKSACMHALASRKRIKKGEIVNVDICGVFNRYHANLGRTFSMGKAHPDVRKRVDASAGSFELLKNIVRPNMLINELTRKLAEYYKKKRIDKECLWFGGYDLGIAFPPDWVGSFAYDADTDLKDRRFVPGTVVNYESNFYLPRRAGVSLLINTIEFKDKEARLLSRLGNELIQV